MKILFTYENPLPNRQADAEVFISTARHLAPYAEASWLHVPAAGAEATDTAAALAGMAAIPAWAPLRPAALRHFCCGLTLPLRGTFRAADFIYTRNLWVAAMAVLWGQRVVFDHYRPWPDQVPPLQPLIHLLFRHQRFLLNICHSDYTRRKYVELGVPPAKLLCIHNGFDPARFAAPVAVEDAKRAIGVPPARKTVVYTGRINHKKGLALVIAAAKRLAGIQFILVGSEGEGPIEALARPVPNIRIVPWQNEDSIGGYIFAADVLLIPPSRQPLAAFGSTVLPLKLFLYLGSGRPILAGRTPDVAEVLRDGENALLCQPDSLDDLVRGIETLTADTALAARLAAAAAADSRGLTWVARAEAISRAIAPRLGGAAKAEGGWTAAQSKTWLRESWLWLQNLWRARSAILPPRAG